MHGYSSSEESDDPYRPRHVPAKTSSNDQKKKKKKTPPQPSINQVWKGIQEKKFNKAFAVLPFDPVLPASLEKPNELLNNGFERAAEECRRRVEKIIQECYRVSSQYRDPKWDLDWDLKREKGYCLNSLGHTQWPLCRTTLSDPSALIPKAIKRVHEVFEKPTFLKNAQFSASAPGSTPTSAFKGSYSTVMAYAKAHGDFASLAGALIGEGLADLSGGVTTELLTSDILDLECFWENELAKVSEEFLFGCSTGVLDGGYGERNGISEGHAYVVMEARTLHSGERLIKLRNPWCAQRWIGVEVPWKLQFNEKFQVKLSKGLQGQYSFYMHFRIHERDRHGAEDFIVRSHGNHLMDRSVSIELPDMPAGYSIFMSVTGERDTSISSVEDVVKRECKKSPGYERSRSSKEPESRQKERHKLWKRQHINREVTKQQTKKNNYKRDRKLAKKADIAKAKDESSGSEPNLDSSSTGNGEETKTASDDKSEGDADGDSNKRVADDDKAAAIPVPISTPKIDDSDGDSCDSPIEDWEELYIDDDMVGKPRLTPQGPPKRHDEHYESEEEGLPDPWNATCIVGVRVYSMGEDLEVHIVMEGSELLEGGMGKKGEVDPDNAQVNSGGEREQREDLESDEMRKSQNLKSTLRRLIQKQSNTSQARI
ncbi:calpain family cysteine protease [Colletotrichum orchidophilum]|uniref:Calpain family cysteine protease n=1 Tax=Colletotrichum orchidophilum TaxID=1209926 RepID=A0A1G4AQG2_9PEZI|nr:calpain family cysteine protease [Colletotrichum orchidophilum]OHE91414.1 calpain family cysteine protease [Colletotrichum orchidophilum]